MNILEINIAVNNATILINLLLFIYLSATEDVKPKNNVIQKIKCMFY